MGSIINAGAIHIVAQANIDAARIKQKAYNARQISDAQSNSTVRDANNAASKVITDARILMQSAGNDASMTLSKARQVLRDTNNASAKLLSGAQTSLQEAQNKYRMVMADNAKTSQRDYNEQAEEVAAAQRTIRDARNERAGAQSSLALWSQSLGNKIKLDRAGATINAMQADVLRKSDDMVLGNVSDRMRTAELLGASIAQAAAAGVGGSTIEQYNTAMNLGDALKEERTARALNTAKWQAHEQAASTLKETVASLGYETFAADMDRNSYTAQKDFSAILPDLDYQVFTPEQDFNPYNAELDYTAYVADQDFSVYAPNLDFTQYVDHRKQSLFSRVLTMGAAGVATYFGGPAAGQAVLSANEGIQMARNGDYAGSNAAFNSAMRSGYTGFKTYQSAGYNSWGGQQLNKVGFGSTAGANYGPQI